MSFIRRIAVPFFLLAVAPATAMAAPAWQAELTATKPGGLPALAPVILDYQMSWNGMIDSGTTRIEFAPPDVKKPGTYVVRSSSKSLGAAALLFPYRNSFWSELNPSTLRPTFFQAVEEDNKETVTTTVRHNAAGAESHEVTKPTKKGATAKTVDRKFPIAPTYDIFSAMLHVRSQKLDAGDKLVMLIHPFDNPYLLRINVLGREVHNGQDCIKLTVGMRKIDRTTLELKPYKKLKTDPTMWLSDDADRVPVELRAAAFIGDVRATLVSRRKP